jgi:predicted ATPase
MSSTFLALAPAGVPLQPAHVLVPGASRAVAVPLAAGRACRFTFEELCQAALSAADYLALCTEFDAFVLDNVPTGM